MNEVLDLLRAHRSIRAYDSAPIDNAVVEAAVGAAAMAATSSHVMAYSLIRVRDDACRDQFVELTGGQPYVRSCGAFFVVCADEHRNGVALDARSRDYETNFESFLVSVVDASLFAQNLVVAFESLGYGICYIGGLRNDLPTVRELLKLPDRVYPLYGLCVGEPEEDPAPKPRLPVSALLHEDRYKGDTEAAAEIEAFDKVLAEYYEERDLKGRDWSGGLARKFSRPNRDDVVEFYRQQGAKF